MTETRKAIIELIEPYMNKTLCEGCITKQWRYSKIIWKDYNENWEFNDRYRFIDDWENYFTWLISAREIIWHYDITAIVKYFENSIQIKVPNGESRSSSRTFNSIDVINICIFDKKRWYWEEHFKIPNKPLHLYTEQEDKDLLKLLLIK